MRCRWYCIDSDIQITEQVGSFWSVILTKWQASYPILEKSPLGLLMSFRHDAHSQGKCHSSWCMLLHLYGTTILLGIRCRMVLHPFMDNTVSRLRSFSIRLKSWFHKDKWKAKHPNLFQSVLSINTTTSILVYPMLSGHSSWERLCSHHNMLL